MFPLCRLIPKKTNFAFVRFAGPAAILSIVAVLVSLASLVTGGLRQSPAEIWAAAGPTAGDKLQAFACTGFNCGIDFKGGTLIEVEGDAALDLARVRSNLTQLGVGDVQVQSFGDPTRALIRFETPETQAPAEVLGRVQASLREAVPNARFPRVEVVGPKVSEELFTGGVLALGIAILLMLVYIWFRFEWQFGLGSVLALFHDVILTLGLFSIMRFEFTLTIIAALLTIIGYSMNDTVVVFDRLRENLRKFKRMSLGEVIDLSTNETLSRTIITGVTALLALIGLLFVGGEALAGFAIAMIFGIVIGTYSSIYVAAPAILIWGVQRGQAEGKDAPAVPTP